jgi:putative restriction endonuclease
MRGTVAVTDYGWYLHLRSHPELEEVNFWKPSAARTFSAPAFSPFFFKLKAPHNAICGFGYFARYSSLPAWLAWETFGDGNGVGSLAELRERIATIRERIRFAGSPHAEIGCVLIAQPVFFDEADWVRQPTDWKARTVQDKGYDLTVGEGARIWGECLERSHARRPPIAAGAVLEPTSPRFGEPTVIRPRLGQGIFRIAVTEAYDRTCAVTREHSLPALEAAHIRAYAEEGPHEVRNGLLLRADFHRLFDQGYVTVTEENRLVVSSRLKEEFDNGHSYYPFHGKELRLPADAILRPYPEFLAWHRETMYIG